MLVISIEYGGFIFHYLLFTTTVLQITTRILLNTVTKNYYENGTFTSNYDRKLLQKKTTLLQFEAKIYYILHQKLMINHGSSNFCTLLVTITKGLNFSFKLQQFSKLLQTMSKCITNYCRCYNLQCYYKL